MKKVRIVLLGISVALFTASASHAAPVTVDSSSYVFNTDTIAVRTGMEPAKMLLAANLPDFQPKVYKHVPLAIDSFYFRDKSGYITDFTAKYLKSHNRTLTTVKDRAQKVFPLIDNILETSELPKELKYLSVIESALNNNARSRVGAVGPWQFMSFTGREMGLVVNSRRDDRKDWVRSTHAAVRYMKQLYNDLDDWLLVIAAYNCGPRPVLRAINRTGSTNFWDIKHLLPRETQNHVLAFVATATIFEKLDHYIGTNVPEVVSYENPMKLTVPAAIKKGGISFTEEELKSMAIVRINQPINFELLVQELGMDKDLLNKWNADYSDFEYNNGSIKEYSLRIPKVSLDKFIEKKAYLTKRSVDVYRSQNM